MSGNKPNNLEVFFKTGGCKQQEGIDCSFSYLPVWLSRYSIIWMVSYLQGRYLSRECKGVCDLTSMFWIKLQRRDFFFIAKLLLASAWKVTVNSLTFTNHSLVPLTVTSVCLSVCWANELCLPAAMNEFKWSPFHEGSIERRCFLIYYMTVRARSQTLVCNNSHTDAQRHTLPVIKQDLVWLLFLFHFCTKFSVYSVMSPSSLLIFPFVCVCIRGCVSMSSRTCACSPVQCIRSITSNKLSSVPRLAYFTASGSDKLMCSLTDDHISIKF